MLAGDQTRRSPNPVPHNGTYGSSFRLRCLPLHGGKRGIEAFLRREVLPHATDAWYVPDSVKTGYEISFTRYFYKPQPLRTLEEIRADILALEKETSGLLGEIISGSAS